MGSYRLAGAWTQFKEQAKQHWGEFPDGGFYEVECRRDSLARLIQERYGIERDEADRQVDEWLASSVHVEV